MVTEWDQITQDAEGDVDRRLAQVTGHEVGCECKECSRARKNEMLPVWERKWRDEEAAERREKSEMAEARRPAEKLQDTLDRRSEVKAARRGLRARRAAAEHEAARLARKPQRTPEESRTMEQAAVRAADLIATDRTFKKRQKALTRSAAQLRSVTEARVYSESSPFSWYLDVAASKNAESPGHAAATERLQQYGRELRYEAASGSGEGRRAERLIVESVRGEGVREDVHQRTAEQRLREFRAMGTSGGATAAVASPAEGSAFVSPYFLVSSFAPYRGVGRPFTEACARVPLPPYGMHVYTPILSVGASATSQVEGSVVSESSPVGAFESAELQNISGQVFVSQQLFERSAVTGGAHFDWILTKQLHEQWEERCEKYTLGQVYATATSVSGEATASVKALYHDLALARRELSDTAGTRLRATHLFTTTDQHAFWSRQEDKNERPIVVPLFTPGFPLVRGADDFDSAPDPKWARFTGTPLPGGILWFTSDAIEAVGTTTKTRLIISAPEVAVVFGESEPLTTCFEETKANVLQTVVNLRSYVFAITRHAAGSVVLTGGAYLTTQG
jgi:hypothetical protein